MVVSTFLGNVIVLGSAFIATFFAIVFCLAVGLSGTEYVVKASLMGGLMAGVLIWLADLAVFRLLRRPSDAFFWRVPMKYWTLLAPVVGAMSAVVLLLTP
jgi:hypothetical protein